jgi:hypothetical protein
LALRKLRAASLLRVAPLAFAFAVAARESWLFIEASSFVIHRRRHFALFDDAMISMRYASNLVRGHGLVWNPGERVEGFTNPLWVLVMAGVILIFGRIKAILAMQILGALLHAAAALLFARMGSRVFRASPWPVVALLEAGLFWLVMSTYPLRFWSHMGMEVSALLLVGALAWTIALRGPRADEPSRSGGGVTMRLGLLAAVAFLLRPDGCLVVIPPLALACLRSRPLPKAIARAAAPLAIAVTASTALRFAYYGDWLPNTYRLKMGRFPLAFRIENGLGFLQPYLHQVAILAGLALVACLVTRSWRALALVASPALLFAYQVWVGGDPWPYWRQLSPGYPVLLLLVACGCAAASTLLRRRFRRARPLRWIAPIVAMMAMVGAMEPTRVAFADGTTLAYNAAWAKTNVERAQVFRKILRPDARIAVVWGGVTPYYDGHRHAIDILGKCDRVVADQPPDLSGELGGSGMRSVPGHNKTLLRHSVIERDADYTESMRWGNDELSAEDKRRFRWVQIDGVIYLLRRGSPRIDWDAVERERDRVDAPQPEETGGPKMMIRPRSMRRLQR